MKFAPRERWEHTWAFGRRLFDASLTEAYRAYLAYHLGVSQVRSIRLTYVEQPPWKEREKVEKWKEEEKREKKKVIRYYTTWMRLLPEPMSRPTSMKRSTGKTKCWFNLYSVNFILRVFASFFSRECVCVRARTFLFFFLFILNTLAEFFLSFYLLYYFFFVIITQVYVLRAAL